MDAGPAGNHPNLLSALGFLSFVDRPPHGVLGGFLVVSPRGRPLEFHCSAPIRPNRAQEILYGPTLRPFLLGELVGRTLVQHAALSVDAVLIDSLEALDLLREAVDVPVAAVDMAAIDMAALDIGKETVRVSVSGSIIPDAPNVRNASPDQVKIGPFLLTTARGFLQDAGELRNLLVPLVDDLDLCEPFERIRAALDEAQRMSA